jgi:hypothetical protein
MNAMEFTMSDPWTWSLLITIVSLWTLQVSETRDRPIALTQDLHTARQSLEPGNGTIKAASLDTLSDPSVFPVYHQ